VAVGGWLSDDALVLAPRLKGRWTIAERIFRLII
jgi:hypothetical protein